MSKAVPRMHLSVEKRRRAHPPVEVTFPGEREDEGDRAGLQNTEERRQRPTLCAMFVARVARGQRWCF